MNKTKKENYTITKPTIAGNRYRGKQGTGVINVVSYDSGELELMGIIEVHQYEKWLEGDKIKKNTRKGYIRGTIEKLIEIGWEPGATTGGRCYIEETFTPPDENDPEAFLVWENGEVKRVNGKPMYRIHAYSFSANQADILIENPEQNPS